MKDNSVNRSNTLRHQIISVLLFKQQSFSKAHIMKANTPQDLIPTNEGADAHLHILTTYQDGMGLLCMSYFKAKRIKQSHPEL